mgnify:CR=1 FL=1
MNELLGKKELKLEEAFSLCRWIGDQMDLPNIGGKSIKLPSPFSLSEPIDDTLIFFPGSFNPWHLCQREFL